MSIRPWVEGCKHPYAKTYLAYKAKSPWKDTPMKPDDRTAPQKVLSAVTSAMPERLMVDCISFVHTKIYPLARNLKQRMNRNEHTVKGTFLALYLASAVDFDADDLLRKWRGAGKDSEKSGVFGAMGDNCWYEPHKLPSEPQLVFMGNNVNIAADVAILNHDIMAAMINRMDGMPKCNIRVGG